MVEALAIDGPPDNAITARYVALNAQGARDMHLPLAQQPIRDSVARDLVLARACLDRQQSQQVPGQ